MLAASVTAVAAIPWTPDDAMHHALEAKGSDGDSFSWSFLRDDGTRTHHELTLSVSEEDFRRSMDRNAIRHGTLYAPYPVTLYDPGDPFVCAVADHIMEVTDGLSDSDRMRAALNFVQTAVSYVSDEDGYGCDEFWAFPVETLFLHGGDCEDKSALLSSIYGAMGFRSVLLYYPDHVAVGVFPGDSDTYLVCETTRASPSELNYVPRDMEDLTPDVHGFDGPLRLLEGMNTGIAWLRYAIEDVTGI